ncbi:hypothetical protein D3C80_1612900 [compost metagenome]
MAGEAVAGEDQQLVEAGAVHAFELGEQVLAFAVFAGEVQQGGNGCVEGGESVQRRHVQRAADPVADGHGQRPAAQLLAGHDRFEGGEALGAGLGDELHDADEGVFVQGVFQLAHGGLGTGLG